jgi:hypothetical protein
MIMLNEIEPLIQLGLLVIWPKQELFRFHSLRCKKMAWISSPCSSWTCSIQYIFSVLMDTWFAEPKLHPLEYLWYTGLFLEVASHDHFCVSVRELSIIS